MEEAGRRSEELKRRIYLVALVVVIPVLPVIGWLRAAREPFAAPVYAALTIGLVGTLLGLVTRRLPTTRAERLLVLGVVGVVFARLIALTYGLALPIQELRPIVVETIGPTLVAAVLIIYLATDLSRARLWSAALWLAFTLTLLPRAITGWSERPGAVVAFLRQSMILAVVAGLAHGLASLKAQLAEERVRARALDELANTDPLTGVSNRRGAEQALRQELARVERYGGQLVVALFDLDRFKERNDYHGHAAGDQALVAVVETLRAELRATDLVGRWGGDELLVIVPETAPDDVRHSAERWRAVIADLGLTAGPNQVTTSIGLATYRPGDTIDALLTRADRALYEAKGRGGDAVATDDGQAEAHITPAEDGAADV